MIIDNVTRAWHRVVAAEWSKKCGAHAGDTAIAKPVVSIRVAPFYGDDTGP